METTTPSPHNNIMSSSSSIERNYFSIAIASICVVASVSSYVVGSERWIRRPNKPSRSWWQLRSHRSREETTSDISERGESLLIKVYSHIDGLVKCLQDPYHPDSNPRGHIPLCVAENKLSIDLLSSRLMQYETSQRAFSNVAVYGYNNTLGLPGPREAIAYFLAKYFMYPELKDMNCTEALEHVHPEHVAFGAGAGALVSHLALALTDAGDAVLIPAPIYAAFKFDLKIVANSIAFPVYSSNPSLGPTPEELENAALLAEAKGLRVRILLLTNPNNPLGTIYSPECVKLSIDWARSRKMHTIVDEIYALSVVEPGFESVLKILNGDLRNDVHHLYALSKDFCASGFRIGTLYTKNEPLLKCVGNLNSFSGVSHPMQLIVQDLFTDDNFIKGFLETSRQRTRYNYDMCVSRLDQMAIPYIPTKAGIFVYADFSSLLPEMTSEGEERFTTLLLDGARILMTPGQAQFDQKPGMFRICYAYVPAETLNIFMQRLEKSVAMIRRCGLKNVKVESLIELI